MIYEAVCPMGHKTEFRSSVADRDLPRLCEHLMRIDVNTTLPCGHDLKRVLSLTAGHFPGASSWRGGK